MARIRSVHPGLFTDEAWVSCSPLARILVLGLWTEADDQGVFEWKPLQIKMRILPGDGADVAALLAEIEGAGIVKAFSEGGKNYGAIRNFRKFQRPQKPNAIHPLPEFAASFVGLSQTGPGSVRDQYDTDTVEAQQMEDGGDKKEEGRKDFAATVVATGWAKDEIFRKAWDLCTPQMRRRSKSRDQTHPEWQLAAKAVGGAAKVLAALQRYLREDPDINRTGGPGFDVWLRDGVWDVWEPSSEAAATAWTGPQEVRRRVVMEQGENYAQSYLDPARWIDNAVVPRTRYAFDKLKVLRSMHGVALTDPQGAAA